MERSGGARTILRGRAKPRSVVKWSELKRTESGSFAAAVCACWRMGQAQAQPRRNEKRSRSAGLVRQAGQSADALMGRGGRALRRVLSQARDEARAASLASGASPASVAGLAERCLACLATETSR